MIRSMTGFGKAVGEYKHTSITVELRSVNSKYLDLNMRLPSGLRDREPELRSIAQKDIERGKVDLMISLGNGGQDDAPRINRKLVSQYYLELKSISDEMNMPASDFMSAILRIPNVLSADESPVEDDLWEAMKATVNQAVISFNGFRDSEGKSLERDFQMRIESISELLGKIEPFELNRTILVRTRLENQFKEFEKTGGPDRDRFEQELIYYLEKLDITEEKVRLRSHLDYFMETAAEEGFSGKKLNFISQEIGREVNTIGSKASDANIQKFVVQMKDELEKIREQVSNVL